MREASKVSSSLRPPPSSLEKHHHRSTAPFRRARLAVGQYLVAPQEPCGDLALQHRLAVFRPQALAVHYAHATQSLARALREEFHEQLPGIGRVEAVEVELVLDDPVAAAQLPENVGAEPIAHEGELLTRF